MLDNPLLVDEKLYAKYSLGEYIDYCQRIRRSIWGQRTIAKPVKDFFEKQFVEEMEPLFKIAQHVFDPADGRICIQYMQSDPPDGQIFDESGSPIWVECTSARDTRLDKFCIEETKQGRLTSFSGHTSADIGGSMHKGHTLAGERVEAEFVEDAAQNIRAAMCDRIEKKLSKPWLGQRNWLSVFFNDYAMPESSTDLLNITTQQVFDHYRERLVESRIGILWFVGADSWLSQHPTHA